jgi:RNA polymerase sigma factor (sigma-70 family)
MNGAAIAFSELQLRYELYVFLFIIGQVKDKEEAENLCPDTFLKAWEALRKKRYTPEDHFSAWLLAIATHVVNDWKKHKMNRPHEQFTEEMQEQIEEGNPIPVITYSDPYLKELLGKALAKIEAKDYTILMMHVLEEKTYEEISPVVYLSPAAVKQRFLRLCKRLRKALHGLRGKF